MVSGEAAMVMGALISCIKRRKQKDIHSKSNDAITIYVGNLGSWKCGGDKLVHVVGTYGGVIMDERSTTW